MSGLEVIGGISAVIAIIDASVKTWEKAQKDIKLPETFKIVARRLPLLRSTLQICHDQLDNIKDTLPPDVVKSFRDVVQNSKAQARLLRDIFEETVPGEDAKRLDRYRAAIKSVGKGKLVEQLLQSISEDTRVLADYHSVRVAQPDLVLYLEEVIEELRNAEPSVEEEAPPSSAFQNYNYGGQQNISTGHVQHSGHGDQHNYGGVGALNQYSGPVYQRHLHQAQAPPQLVIRSKKHGLCLGNAPLIDVEHFIGRAAELDQMARVLRPGEVTVEQRRLVLGGLGGIGKTQLAIAYARRHQSHYASVFWLNATSVPTLKASIQSVAQQLFTATELQSLNDEGTLQAVLQWLSNAKDTSWLLIFDNYDDPDLYDIKKYLPNTAHGSIIITSRLSDRIKGQRMQQVRVLPISDLNESLEILQTRSQRDNIQHDPFATRLTERLAGLPLALATVGAYLLKTTVSFSEYLDAYERRFNVKPRKPIPLQEYEDRTLYTTWNISYSRLKQEDELAANMLQLLAYFDNQQIWYELLHTGLSEDAPKWLQDVAAEHIEFENVMSTLVDYCLVEAHPATRSYSMHNCVHDWTLTQLNKTVDQDQYWYTVECIVASIRDVDWEMLQQLQYARHTRHALRLMHSHFLQNANLSSTLSEHFDHLHLLANLLSSQVQLSGAEEMYLRALAGKEKALGPDHTSTLHTMHNLGNIYKDRDKHTEAERMYKRALAGKEKVLGLEDPSTLDTVHGLANLYKDQGKLDEAELMYTRALVGREKVLRLNHPSTLTTVNTIGNLYAGQGKLEEAERMYQRALAGRENVLGPDHFSTLDTVNNLGALYQNQGKLDKAEQMSLRALATREKVLGPNHTKTLNTVVNLGILYRSQKKLDEAERMYERALSGFEKIHGPDHSSTLAVVLNLGVLYRSQNRLDEAERMYTRAMTGYQKALGPDHAKTLDVVYSFGNLHVDQGKLEEAERMYQRALTGREKTLGPNHTSTLNTAGRLSLLYFDQGKLTQAAETLYRVLDAYSGSNISQRGRSTIQTLTGTLATSIKADGDDLQAAKRQLASLVDHIDKWSYCFVEDVDKRQYWNTSLYLLARSLLCVKDEENALVAFSKVEARCDGCRRQVTFAQGYHVCRQCDNSDLCNECMSKHIDKSSTRVKCEGHEYYDVTSAKGHTEVDTDTWIDALKKKYRNDVDTKNS